MTSLSPLTRRALGFTEAWSYAFSCSIRSLSGSTARPPGGTGATAEK